jgi:hypothetical protein
MQIALADEVTIEHPIDLFETLAAHREWPCERGTEDDLNLCLSGSYCDYHIAISWRPDLGGLHLACVFDTRVPATKRSEVHELLALINEQLWLGHFDIWSSDGALLFRTTVLVSHGTLSEQQGDDLIEHAIETCERFFPAFQYLMWAGYSPREALRGSLFETSGDA